MQLRKNKTLIRISACLLIALAVSVNIFTFRFGVLDELWEYDFSRAITMGYVPYRDYPVIATPLSRFIFSIPLIFSRTLIAYRAGVAIFSFILICSLYAAVCKNISDRYAICVALFSAGFIEMQSYNFVILLWALLSYLCLGMKNDKLKFFLTGIFAALSPLTKQTSGSILMIVIIVMMMHSGLKSPEKKPLIASFLTGLFIPLFSFLIYLLVTGSFAGFADCCFFGLFSFGGSNLSFRPESALPFCLMIAAGIAGDIHIYSKTRDFSCLFHLLTGLAVLSNAVPIFESYHLVAPAIYFLIPVATLIKLYGTKYIHINMAPIISFMVIFIIFFKACDVIKDPDTSNRWKELRFIPSVKQYDYYADILKKNESYRENGCNVVIFSSDAVILSIMDETFNPPYDCFLNGNLGTKDPIYYAVSACASSDNIILMPNDYNEENWQNPEGIYEYIITSCEKIDSYGEWGWYRPCN